MVMCSDHPDKEATYICSKHNIYKCENCLKCTDPELYCKFRPSCTIWFLYKEKVRAAKKAL